MNNPTTYFAPRDVLCTTSESSIGFPQPNIPYDATETSTLYSGYPNGLDNDIDVINTLDGSRGSFYTPTFLEQKFIPYNPCGAIITGLNDQSTFTLNWIETFERTINSDQKDLIILAQPSAPVNFQALELYSAVWRDLPVGVPVEENGLGEWFLGVCDSIAECVADIGRPILGAVTGYQNTRKAPVVAPPVVPTAVNNTWTQPDHPRKVKIATSKKGGKKSGIKTTDVVSGPRLPNQKFKAKNRNR
jgi:hypothetical protein